MDVVSECGLLNIQRFCALAQESFGGNKVGALVGTVGSGVGTFVGSGVGARDGDALGLELGDDDGSGVGTRVGDALGNIDGEALGTLIGLVLGDVDGWLVGVADGLGDGYNVSRRPLHARVISWMSSSLDTAT